MSRFNIDVEHAKRVKETALHCFDQVRKDWNLPKKRRHTLAWAADLHELGMSITHDKHHLQGAHIIEYADIPGFARRRQHWLSIMVMTHRKKLSPEVINELPEGDRQTILYLIILLRLSVLLHRARKDIAIYPVVEGSDNSLYISCQGNINDQALLEADLIQEKAWLSKLGINLYFE